MPTNLNQLKQPVNQLIPAGLLDGGIEIFYQGTNVYATMSGQCIPFDQWPADVMNILRNDLLQHPLATEAMQQLGVASVTDQVWIYAKCRFGRYDGNADIDANGKILHTEYWDCGMRNQCDFEGRICSHIKAKNGTLTPREIDVIRLTAEDFMNKEIAYKLNISPKTVPVHKRNIIRKIGGRRNGDIIRFAVEHNITHNSQ